jgi:RHS repeat-associated protein
MALAGTTAGVFNNTHTLLHDHIGSVVAVADSSGHFVERADYSAFGGMRASIGAVPVGLTALATTTRGFTGHEQLSSIDTIHMNGRIYDPKLGRFLQADPMVAEPGNPQNWNPYSYVFNNPLANTDPTGMFSIGKLLRTLFAIVVSIYFPEIAELLWDWSALAGTLVAGFAAGVISSGSLQGGLTGAFSAGLFFGIGQEFEGLEDSSGALSDGEEAEKVLAHGIAGGIMASLEGGKFGNGFVAAGLTEGVSPEISKLQEPIEQGVASAVVGGTASILTGGKFGDGAMTAAFSYAFNNNMHAYDDEASSAQYHASNNNISPMQTDDEGRSLSAGEAAAASQELPSLNTDLVRIMYDSWSSSAAYTLDNTIHFPSNMSGCQDFSTCNGGDDAGWFVHEVTHAWQYQNDVSPFWGHIFSLDLFSNGDYLPLNSYMDTPSPDGLSTEKQADWHKWNYLCTNKLKGC